MCECVWCMCEGVCVLISNIDAHTMVHRETTTISIAFCVYIVFYFLFFLVGSALFDSQFGTCFGIACAGDALMAGRKGRLIAHRNIALARSQQKAPP